MQYLRSVAIVTIAALTACTQSRLPSALPVQTVPVVNNAVSQAGSTDHRKRKLGRVVFHITVPARRAGVGRRSHFIPGHAQSIEITLVTVNGAPPPAGAQTTVISNLTNCTSGCTVYGPSSTAGSDAFSLVIFDGLNATGSQLAVGNVTIQVAIGQPNAGVVTMEGIPHAMVLVGSMPAGSGGTAFASAQSLAVNVEDADADVITGTYAQSVTVTDSDTASATLASGLTLTGSAGSCSSPAASVMLTSSTDAANLALCYGGLDIMPATIAATSSLITTPLTIGTFSPSVAPILYSGPLNASSKPEIDLWVANGPSGGTGSFGTWTVSQLGWTNGPYGKPILESDNCNGGGNTISTLASSGSPAGTSWQSNAVSTPAVGSCSATLSGGAGAQLAVLNTYTTTSYGVDLKTRIP